MRYVKIIKQQYNTNKSMDYMNGEQLTNVSRRELSDYIAYTDNHNSITFLSE